FVPDEQQVAGGAAALPAAGMLYHRRPRHQQFRHASGVGREEGQRFPRLCLDLDCDAFGLSDKTPRSERLGTTHSAGAPGKGFGHRASSRFLYDILTSNREEQEPAREEHGALEQEDPLSEPLSLAGRRVLITRARHQAGEMAAMVRDYGGTALCLPLTALGPPADPAPLDRALAGLDQVHWLVFTSPNAVDFTLSRLKALKGAQAAEALSRCSLAAVGPGTAAALARWGPQARLMPTKFRWQELAQELLAQSRPGDHFLLPRSDRAVPQLP